MRQNGLEKNMNILGMKKMKAKDTVDPKLIAYIRIVSSRPDWDLEIAEKQAEISFKAGIIEVVEWIIGNGQSIETAHESHMSSGEFFLGIDPDGWQAKLKEWGI